MPGITRPARAVAAAAAAIILFGASVAPASAGDELVVQPGDTLWDIARNHGTTVAELVRLNDIENPSLIRVGQRIVLTPPTAAAPPPPAAGPSGPTVIHVVRAGETLWAISLRYGTTVAALAAANSVADPSFIRTGQQLVIPALTSASPPPPPAVPAVTPPASSIHVVRAGETLWAIALRYGTSVAALAAANQIADPSFIRTGQQLVIPGTPAAAAPSATTAGMPPDMAAKVAARTASRDLLLAAAAEFGVPGAFVLAVAWHESGWQTGVVSSAGAVGLMQLMPATAEWVAGSMLHEAAAISDPRWNARAGARLLAYYLARYSGDRATVLAAYFQGMSSVDTRGILASSGPYIDDVLALERLFSR